MYLSFNHLWASCKREDDAGSDGEFYWTWQVRTGGIDETSVARGFTEGIAAKEGYRIEEGSIRLNLFDPKFIIELPKLEQPGDSNRVSIRFYCFEHDSDKDTVSIKTLFSNKASQFLIDFAEREIEDRDEAKKELLDFLGSSGESGLSSIISGFGAPIPTGLTKVPGILFGLVDNALSTLLKNGDDLVGSRRIDLFYSLNAAGKLQYRWSFEDGVQATLSEENEAFQKELIFINAKDTEEVHSNIQLQLVLDLEQL